MRVEDEECQNVCMSNAQPQPESQSAPNSTAGQEASQQEQRETPQQETLQGNTPVSVPTLTAESTPKRADLDKKTAEIAGMFDWVAPKYDLVNDLMSLGQVRYWRWAMVHALGPAAGQRILDVAAGTGTSSVAIAKCGAEVVACDLSEGMVRVGRERHPELEFIVGDVTHLPFADNSFDSVTISFGLRNVADTQTALREMLRVTKPGGRLVVCEFSTPTFAPFRWVYRKYLQYAMPVVAKWFSSDEAAYDYLAESILDWPNQTEFQRTMRNCGWESVTYQNLTGGIVALHRGIKR